MKLKILFILFLNAIFTVVAVANDNEIQTQRFNSHLDEIQSAFVKSSGEVRSLEEVVESLLKGSKRVAVFNLQALGKIYSDFRKDGESYENLFRNTIRFEFKSIEDGIGEVKQHEEHLDDPEISEKNKLKYERYKAAAKEILKYVLTGDESFLEGGIPEDYRNPNGKQVKVSDNITHEGEKIIESFRKLSGRNPNPDKKISDKYENYLKRHRSLFWDKKWYPYGPDSKVALLTKTLLEFPWDDYAKDRKYLLGQLSDLMENLAKTKFDFEFLENGDDGEKGLHEYRREIRWFAFEAGILNGTINTRDDNSCPIKDYKDIVEREDLQKSNYTKFPSTPFPGRENVCYISKCLYYKVADVIDEFGELKDDSKKYNRQNDIKENKTPKKYRKKAEEIAEEVEDNELFETISEELKSCI